MDRKEVEGRNVLPKNLVRDSFGMTAARKAPVEKS
jgi:hypothetical protein